MAVTVNIPESVIQAFPLQERAALRSLVDLITAAVDTSQAALTLDDLADVSAAAPTNDQVLTFDSVDDRWEAQDAGGGGGAAFASYTPTLTNELNAGGAGTVVLDEWTYTQDDNGVFCTVGLTIDGNASGGDYFSNVSFNLPSIAGRTADTGTIFGCVNGVASTGTSVSGRIYYGAASGSGGSLPQVEIYMPSGISGVISLYGTFGYKLIAA